MKTLTLFLLIANSSFALEPDEIRKIAAEPHDRTNILEELKLYPDAREYTVTVRSGAPGGELQPGPAVVATEKVVQGRYMVTEAKFPAVEDPLIMVVTFDDETDTFKKWVLLPNGIVASSTGVADLKKRTIAWISVEPHGEPPTTFLSIETHADDKSTWKETTLQGGKVVGLSRGIAVKTK